jgi:hypothetical protein
MFRFRTLRPLAVSAVATTLTIGLLAPTGAFADDNEKNDPKESIQTINLPTGWRPEGITAGRGDTLYVGSLANGAIWKTDAKTGAGSVLTPGATGKVSVGVDFDKRNDRLWVAGGRTGEVRVVDATSGAVLQTYVIPGAANVGFLNDVVATKNAVYVTDSSRSLLAVIATPRGVLPPSNAATILPLTNGAVGNGIVFIDGWLIVVQSATGFLFRVDPNTGIATRIDLGGYLVTNGDGLEPGDDGELFVVRNRSNLVAQLKLDENLLQGKLVAELRNPNFDIPTTAALQNGQLWAVNARFGTAIPPETSAYSINAVTPVDDDNDEDHD